MCVSGGKERERELDMEKEAKEGQKVRGEERRQGLETETWRRGQRAGQGRTEHSRKWGAWAHPRWAVPMSVKAPCDTCVCAPLSTHSPSLRGRCPQRPFLLPLLPSV